MSNSIHEITFDLNVLENKENLIHVEDIALKGYYCTKFRQLNKKQLLTVIKGLARRHSLLIAAKKKSGTEIYNSFDSVQCEANVESIYEIAATLQKDIDVELLRQGVDHLLSNRDVLQISEIDFSIIGSTFHKKIYFKGEAGQCTECKLLDLQTGRPVCIVYDMLCLVYRLTTQKQRQQLFHEMTGYYYYILEGSLQEFGIDLNQTLSSGAYERKIKCYIPYVKLELISFLLPGCSESGSRIHVEDINSNNDFKALFCETVSELYEHVLTPRITREDCFKIVMDSIGTNYDSLSFVMSEEEDLLGLLGEYSKLKIVVTGEGGEEVLNLFAKFLPKGLGVRFPLSAREEFVYNTFISELNSVGLGEISSFGPKCYFVRPSEVLIFEDLCFQGYRVLNCDETFSYEMLEVVVKQLAKMHSCSLLYEEITTKELGVENRIGSRYREYVQETVYVKGLKFSDVVNNCGINATINYVFDQFPDIPKEISMDTFRERTRKLFDLMYEKFKVSERYRSVLCHGDIWGGNILFKFDANRVVDCRLIDFQLIRYCLPAHDLLAFLYINTDKSTRTKYMSKLIDVYYKELLSKFKKYDLDLHKIYSYDHFIESVEYMRSQAVCLAALTYPNSLDRAKVQHLLDDSQKKIRFFSSDKTDVLDELMKDNRIRSRFREIVEDLYELCVDMV